MDKGQLIGQVISQTWSEPDKKGVVRLITWTTLDETKYIRGIGLEYLHNRERRLAVLRGYLEGIKWRHDMTPAARMALGGYAIDALR